jgi:enoyl-[acyl-carrier-protein] reductase (NADH)
MFLRTQPRDSWQPDRLRALWRSARWAQSSRSLLQRQDPNVSNLWPDAGASIFLPLNFQIPGQLDRSSTRDWGRIDFLVHSVASAPKETLRHASSMLHGRDF